MRSDIGRKEIRETKGGKEISMKKTVAVVISMLLGISMIACSASEAENTQGQGSEAVETQSAPAAAESDAETASAGEYEYGVTEEGYTVITNLDTSEEVTLTMAGWEGGPSETDNLNQALELFHEYYPNITVEYTPSADSGEGHHGKIMTMFAANSAPDVFYCGSAYVHEFADRGIIYDITDIFNQVFSLDDYIPAALQCMQYNGRLYGITSCNVGPQLYYNKDLFDEAGVEYPSPNPEEAWTWEEFIDAAEKLTKTDENGKVTQYGFYGLEDSELLTAYFNQFDMQYMSEDGKSFTATDDPNFKKIFENIKSLRTEYGVSPQAAFTESAGMNNVQMLLTGMVAMFVEGSWGMEETAESGVNFGVAPLPVMDGGHSATWGQAHIHSIAANTEHFDEAWALLCFLGSDEYQLNMVREGLWTPNKTSCYEPEVIQTWLTENHPDGYDEFIYYFKDFSSIAPQTVMGGEAYDIFTEECQAYFDGNEDLDTVISDMRSRVDEVLQE